MILYHGGPITPMSVAVQTWTNRHALVSFAYQDQLELAAGVSRSFVFDNGAFTTWKNGLRFNRDGYYKWVEQWHRHPGFDWALIPDIIDGDEESNDACLAEWPFGPNEGVPVWHLHESLDRLERLISGFPRVALGSSGEWAVPNAKGWWTRMTSALSVCCDEEGRPRAKLHGLRMMNPRIFSRIPFSSVDSSAIARNVGLDVNWEGRYQPRTKKCRAAVMIDRLEAERSAVLWRPKGVYDETPDISDRQMVLSLSVGLEGTETVLDKVWANTEGARTEVNRVEIQ